MGGGCRSATGVACHLASSIRTIAAAEGPRARLRRRSRCSARLICRPATGMTVSNPAASSASMLSRDTIATPIPATTAALIASVLPNVNVASVRKSR